MMQKISIMIIFILLTISNIAAEEGKKILKWVDSKGVTQYGDKLPASEAGRNNAVMNTQGMVVKKNVIADKVNTLQDQQKLEQERKDKILLASYTNAEEIDLAKERNLQLDKAAFQALSQQKISVANRAASNKKLAEGFKARNKPLPVYLSDELKLTKVVTANINKQLAQRKLSMAATDARYTDEKKRFIALKQPMLQPAAQANGAGSSPASNETAGAKATKANNMAATLTTQP